MKIILTNENKTEVAAKLEKFMGQDKINFVANTYTERKDGSGLALINNVQLTGGGRVYYSNYAELLSNSIWFHLNYYWFGFNVKHSDTKAEFDFDEGGNKIEIFYKKGEHTHKYVLSREEGYDKSKDVDGRYANTDKVHFSVAANTLNKMTYEIHVDDPDQTKEVEQAVRFGVATFRPNAETKQIEVVLNGEVVGCVVAQTPQEEFFILAEK